MNAMSANESKDQKETVAVENFCNPKELQAVRVKAIALSKMHNKFVQEDGVRRVKQIGRRAVEGGLHAVVLRAKKYKVVPGTRDEKGSCSCPYFMDKLICKHYLGLRLMLVIVRVLPAMQHRKVGRPRKRKRALEYQSDDEQSDEGEKKAE